MLLLTAFIWGTAFVAQSVGMEYLGPFGFNGIRNFVGSLALLPCIFLLNKINRSIRSSRTERTAERQKSIVDRRDLLWVVPVCGKYLQQIGMQYTSVGKCGFIYRFCIVLVRYLVFFKEESWMESLDGSSACSGGTVFFMYH